MFSICIFKTSDFMVRISMLLTIGTDGLDAEHRISHHCYREQEPLEIIYNTTRVKTFNRNPNLHYLSTFRTCHISRWWCGYKFVIWYPGSVFRQIFRPPLGPTQPPIKCILRGGGLSCGIKAAGAWSWPVTSVYSRGKEYVELYLHSPVRLHGFVLS
jgi:hypothetical protein